MHVDEFIKSGHTHNSYARMVLHYMRLPSMLKVDFHPWLGHFKLFCVYQGQRYRVIMASRLGDIGLSRDLESDKLEYNIRVYADECAAWSADPNGDFAEPEILSKRFEHEAASHAGHGSPFCEGEASALNYVADILKSRGL